MLVYRSGHVHPISARCKHQLERAIHVANARKRGADVSKSIRGENDRESTSAKDESTTEGASVAPSDSSPDQAQQLDRSLVMQSCLTSSAAMAAIGTVGVLLGTYLSQGLRGDSGSAADALLQLPSAQWLAVSIASGLAVTGTRFGLMAIWADLRDSNNTSNSQVLLTQPALSTADVAAVACLPAISEEVLFRGALVGNAGSSVPAALAVGLLFGVLHVSGGRNYASGVFAAAAGVLYGIVFVLSGSVAAAAVAHAVGNSTSAAAWLSTRQGK